MRALAITNPGIEDISASEISELTGAKCKVRESCVEFEFSDFKSIFTVCYRAQSVRKVLLLLSDFEIKGIECIRKMLAGINISEWIGPESSFVVRSIISGSSLISQEVEAMTGEFILDKIKSRVDLKSPSSTFFVFIEGRMCYLGIDFSGEDLGKRDYRIFTGAEPLKPTVAYSLLRIASYSKEKVLLDPFCRSGTITIEAALFASAFSPNFFRKDRFLFKKLKKFESFDFSKFFESLDSKADPSANLKITAAGQNFSEISSSKKNAGIAGILKCITFSRKDPEWLDVRFRKKSVDIIASFPPISGRVHAKEKIEKIHDTLFYQADYILKDSGIVALLLKDTDSAEKAAAKYRMKAVSTRTIMQGQDSYEAVVFAKEITG